MASTLVAIVATLLLRFTLDHIGMQNDADHVGQLAPTEGNTQ